MKKFLLFLFSFSFLFAYDTLWFRLYGTDTTEWVPRIGIDPLGNIILGATVSSRGIILIKCSPSGETIWSKIIGDEDRLYLEDLAVDKEGNIIGVGFYRRGYPPEYGAYMVKCDNEGNILFVKKWTINYNYGLDCVVCDDSNNIIVCGSYDYYEDGKINLIKFSPNGDSIWGKTYNFDVGSTFEIICGLKIDREGNIIGTGGFGDIIPCLYDLITVKFDKNGDTIWVSRLNFNRDYNYGIDIAIDSFNNIYVCGYAGFFQDFCPLVIKYHQNGDTIWARFYEIYLDYGLGNAISIDKYGDILITGWEGVFGGISITILIKYSPFGDTILSKRYNFSPGRGMGASDMVLINDSNYIYITGICDTGKGYDIYLMKLLYYPAISEKFSKKILSTPYKTKEIYDITGKKIKDFQRVKKGIYFFKDKYFKKVIILR